MKVHTRGKPLGNVDLAMIARQTSGLTGADLANLCNEAAIFARAPGPRVHRPRRLRHRARARGGRHAVAPHAQRPRAPRRRVPRGRPRAVRGAAARRRPRAQDLDRAPRPRARLHAEPAGGGPLPQDARGAHRLHDGAARRPRGGGDRVRRDHHRRVGRPRARGGDLALDDPRLRDGHHHHVAAGVGRGRPGLRPHARAARRGAAAPLRRGDARRGQADPRPPRRSSTSSPSSCSRTRCSSATTSSGSCPASRASTARPARACAWSRSRRRRRTAA